MSSNSIPAPIIQDKLAAALFINSMDYTIWVNLMINKDYSIAEDMLYVVTVIPTIPKVSREFISR